MKNIIELGKIGPYKWAVYYDQDPQNPLTDWEDLCIFPYWNSRYILGKTDGNKEFGGPEEFLRIAKAERYEVLSVFAYIHSGVTVRTSPFSCQWNSGQVGYIAITPEIGRKIWGKKWRKDARAYMENIVDTFDKYLRGECYGFEVTHKGEFKDSCFGFYDLDDAIGEAKAAAEYLNEKHQSGKEFARRFMCC